MNSTEKLKEFYPTPPELIAKMLKGIRPDEKMYVLEPSAGKGDLALFWLYCIEILDHNWFWNGKNPNGDLSLDEVRQRIIEEDVVKLFKDKNISEENDLNTSKIDCIEKEPILRNVLKGKDLRVIGSDFLRYNGDKKYDVILMNPPFSNGDEHLLHAIEIGEKYGSIIISLLNAETIKNPYTNNRKLLLKKLEENNAEIEYVQDAFLDAERTTNVEVAIVRLRCSKPVFDGSEIFNRLKKKVETIEKETECQQLVTGKEYEQAVTMYKTEIEVGKEIIKTYKTLSPYILSVFQSEKAKNDPYVPEPVPVLQLIVAGQKYKNDFDFNKFVYAVRHKYWEKLLNEASFLKNLTTDLQNEYRSRINEYANYDFSLENIYEIAIQAVKDSIKGIENKILSVFESFTYKYSTECQDNIHYFNGWKTNKAFLINKKVIIPVYAYKDYLNKFAYWEVQNQFLDIEKVFDNLLGVKSDDYDLIDRFSSYQKSQTTKNLHFKYFDITFYKKGTAHITFTNEKALKMLNIYGCQKKGWLPPSYGTKPYEEMSTEEQNVVDEFQGKKDYDIVFANKSDYIISNPNRLLIDTSSQGNYLLNE